MTKETFTRIVEYNHKWPDVYVQEKQRINTILDQPVIAAEHIGSTAVPGLSARPIIDIALLLPSGNRSDVQEVLLDTDSYEPCSFNTKNRGFTVLIRPESEPPHVSLFLCERGTENGFKRLLGFRELLRSDRELARRYERLKQGLSEEFTDDPATYNAEKSAFIHTLEEVYLQPDGAD